jgi:hypothetical protein
MSRVLSEMSCPICRKRVPQLKSTEEMQWRLEAHIRKCEAKRAETEGESLK